MVSNIAQAICAVLILRALAPRLWGARGSQPLDQLKDFWPVVAASVVGSLVGAAVGGLGRGLLLDRLVRDGCCGVVVPQCHGMHRHLHDRAPGTSGLAGPARSWWARTLLGERRGPVRSRRDCSVAFTVTIYLAVFGVFPFLPVAFLLLVPTVWAGLRFSALGVALHSLAVCTLVVVFTLQERGPFAAVGPWNEEVLVSQLFIALVFCLGILLSLGRGERLSLTANLSSARAVSESQAEVLSAIIDTMHDGVTLIDESGQVLRRNPAGAELVRTDTDRLNNIARVALHHDDHTTAGALRQDEYPWVRAIAGENVVDQDIVIVFDDGSPSRTLAVSARRLPTRRGRHAPGGHGLPRRHQPTGRSARRSSRSPASWRTTCVALSASSTAGPRCSPSTSRRRDGLSREQAAPKLERIQAAAHGMHRLIDDLLDSSISREQQLRSDVVDLEAVARSVADQRALLPATASPQIEVGRLPVVYADAALVRQLLDNLVANAVKYVVPGHPGPGVDHGSRGRGPGRGDGL